MRKEIIVGDQSVEINTSAGWLFVYREQFGRDILSDVVPLLDAFAGASADVAKAMLKEKNGEKAIASEEIMATEVLRNMDPDTLQELIYKAASLESITLIKMLWAMAKNADESIPAVKQWANTFEVMPMDEIVPEIVNSIMEGLASSKKFQSLQTKLKKIRSRLPRSQSAGSPEALISKA